MHATYPLLKKTDFPAIRRKTLDTLQVNLGYKCNQTCQHCHVNAGPARKEMMDRETVDLVLQVLRDRRLTTLDMTGGAPEMNAHFRYLVREARALGVHVIDRCNLTILFEPGQEALAEFPVRHKQKPEQVAGRKADLLTLKKGISHLPASGQGQGQKPD